MSMHLEFEPHSWYMGFAIRDNRTSGHDNSNLERPLDLSAGYRWSAYSVNGMTGFVVERHADTLKQVKEQIREYQEAYNVKMERLYR